MYEPTAILCHSIEILLSDGNLVVSFYADRQRFVNKFLLQLKTLASLLPLRFSREGHATIGEHNWQGSDCAHAHEDTYETSVEYEHEYDVTLFDRELLRTGIIAHWNGPGTGLFNLNNSCYMNAILRALFHIPVFANWLSYDRVHPVECEEKGKY